MAIKYPSITPASTNASPNANHLAIKLPTTQGNGIFNTFTLDYAGERQTAYSVIVIQNAQAQATPSVMNVSSIELSETAIANGFSLDPVDTSGNLEMGANVTLNGIAGAPVDGINRIKAVSAITNFDRTVSDGGDIAFDTATHCLLLPPLAQNGGAAHGGVNANAVASPEILLDQLNTTATSAASGTFRVLPLYKTTDIAAGSGETNPINQNEYAAFVIRYAPGENQAPSSIELSTLTITTSAGTSVIGLSYSASNIFTPGYQFGRYSINAGTLLLEGSDYVSKPSGATLAMGLFPVGTNVNTTSSARHLLRVDDQSPQTTNSATNISDNFSMSATTIQDATPHNFLESTELNNVGAPWVDSDIQLITDGDAIDNAYWYMTLMYSSTGAVNGSNSSIQIHGTSANEAPFNFTKAEATMAAQIKFSWSVAGPTSPSFLNHLFKVTGGFYYQLSLNASGGVLTNNSTVAANHRRRALRTQSIGILGSVAQDTMFSGDKFNLKIICNYQNYSGAAFATASVPFATQFPLTKGTYAYAEGDYIFPINYKPNTTSTASIDIPASTAWDTSGIVDAKQDFVIEVPVQAKGVTNLALYSNDSYDSNADLTQGAVFLAGRSIAAGLWRTNPATDSPGGRQNDGSYSAEVAIDGNVEGYFTDKLGPYSQSYFVEFYPIQARIKCHARPSDAEDNLQINLGSVYGWRDWQYNLQKENYSNFYDPRTRLSIAAADIADNPLFETGQATAEAVTNWYQVGSATAVPNTAAAFHAIDATTDAIQSGIDYNAGNNLDEVFFSGSNGAVIKNQFKTATNSYYTNPSLATYDSQTNAKTSRFDPDNTIMVKAAKYHAADQHWYADVDLKFDNSGQEETLLWKTTVEASNLVDAESAPVKPSGANTPLYKVVTLKSLGPNSYAASSTGLYSTITDGNRITDLYKNTIGTSTFLQDTLNATFAIIPPKRKGVGETATSGYAAAHFKRPNPAAAAEIQATYGGFTKIRFKLDNNSSAAGNYYAMVTVESIDNSFDNNMQWDDEDSVFKSADIDHADFKLSVHRFIIKFTVSPNSDLVVTDSDTSDNLEANSTINFGNITVG